MLGGGERKVERGRERGKEKGVVRQNVKQGKFGRRGWMEEWKVREEQVKTLLRVCRKEA